VIDDALLGLPRTRAELGRFRRRSWCTESYPEDGRVTSGKIPETVIHTARLALSKR